MILKYEIDQRGEMEGNESWEGRRGELNERRVEERWEGGEVIGRGQRTGL